MRLLLIEDDIQLGKALREGLNEEYATDWFRSAEEGADALAVTAYDLIVLDINLPGMTGLEWLKRLRQEKQTLPILLLTARKETADRVTGLNSGADDYLPKPFDFEELLARIRALGRRRPNYQASQLSYGPLVLDVTNQRLSFHERPISISARECIILRLLLEQPGQTVSKERIEAQLYTWDDAVSSNTIEVHISSLRRKLGKSLIRNTRNLGYSIALPS